MTPIRKTLLALAASASLVLPGTVQARPWLLPSETMFTGAGNEWLTVDAANSTDLYYYDHPGQPWDAIVTAPDGSIVPVENRMVGKLRQVFDVPITKPGTYKLSVDNDMIFGSYMLTGEKKTLPRGTTPATLAAAIPAGATDVQTAEANNRIETFVTAGEPTTTVFKATGKGIEMIPVTHPNDLAVDEPATFQFLLDGKPAAGLDVVAIPGGIRYRQDIKQMDAKTDAEGKVSFTWPEAGMYWVSVSIGNRRAPPAAEGQPPAPPPADAAPERRASYAMTVEVQG
ncbi:conserved exported protein of unknown function [uncultured Sphingopyxis sp.]|uniref:Uncharacterized protein n=1 Tax=uncultured Sphingopyxis sp. TaxID=310581 RepID=A0A1Y5PPE1_9SPHN|nr:DUF4198 domain-containing protein [uncultured Sphingopyxis sp.]SBV31840.1 conserved exported protein of unknown function [uncultured Sphingopyxis sp.]